MKRFCVFVMQLIFQFRATCVIVQNKKKLSHSASLLFELPRIHVVPKSRSKSRHMTEAKLGFVSAKLLGPTMTSVQQLFVQTIVLMEARRRFVQFSGP